jgi:hypothetical protein
VSKSQYSNYEEARRRWEEEMFGNFADDDVDAFSFMAHEYRKRTTGREQRDERDVRREYKEARRKERLNPEPVVIDADFVDLIPEARRLGTQDEV